MVFLSNLVDKTDPNGLSNNQVMHSGPCLNQKLSIALILLRFDPLLLIFDLRKAFLMIQLPKADQDKLMFLWHKNVDKDDFSFVVYRNVRLSFGLRCSPVILMVGLYIILVCGGEKDDPKLKNLKLLIYTLIYMDNGAITVESSQEMMWAYQQLKSIFGPYKFELQQFCSNDSALNEKLENSEQIVKLFGIKWDTTKDVLFAEQICLKENSTTKRQILKTVAEQFDPFNFHAPLLNRARIFLHELQNEANLSWDDKLAEPQLREWRNICKQANCAPPLLVPRFVGRRSGRYRMICFTDSSKTIYGAVIFLQDLSTNIVSFLLAKNRIVNKQLETKTIPALEFSSIVLGAEILTDLKNELCGSQSFFPINIVQCVLYSDSLVCLNWINSYFKKYEKMNKKSVFILNRLQRLGELCAMCPITFTFVDGICNPADAVTRPLSYKQLSSSTFLTGPEFLMSEDPMRSREDILCVEVPNPVVTGVTKQNSDGVWVSTTTAVELNQSHIVSLDRFSHLDSFIKVHRFVFQFVENLKCSLKNNHTGNDLSWDVRSDCGEKALQHILKTEQKLHYGEVIEYFSEINTCVKSIPNIVLQLNLFLDRNGILRVGSKVPKEKNYGNKYFPILLNGLSKFTELLILSCHEKLRHSGIYSVLNEIRRIYWVPKCFSVIRRILKNCVHCKRYNARTVKLNQSNYRDFRLDPSTIPYSTVFIDHMGPWTVNSFAGKVKVWVLVLTCLFTRAINLKVCEDLTTSEFLRQFQLHSFEYGLPRLVLSDLGSQLVAGANIVSEFLDDSFVREYFAEHGCKITEFNQYYKGRNELGSLVEISVKLCKRLFSASVGRNILNVRDFEFLVSQAVHLVNRRPVAFKEGLRDCSGEQFPDPITPELLLRGYHLLSANIIPQLQTVEDREDLDYSADPTKQIQMSYSKLCNVRRKLLEVYHEQFVTKLIAQATDVAGRYRPVNHTQLRVGDVVLIKELHTKPLDYPMAIVKSVVINDLGEVTGAAVLKGSTGEIIKRHSSVLIPLLAGDEVSNSSPDIADTAVPAVTEQPSRQRRQAAVQSEHRTKMMLE